MRNNYSLSSHPNIINKLGELKYTTNLDLKPYEKLFLENIFYRTKAWGIDCLITSYDIKGINEIYDRIFCVVIPTLESHWDRITHKSLF